MPIWENTKCVEGRSHLDGSNEVGTGKEKEIMINLCVWLFVLYGIALFLLGGTMYDALYSSYVLSSFTFVYTYLKLNRTI